MKYNDIEISFLIALKIDSRDRLNNLEITLNYLKHYFPNSEVILSEFDIESKIPDYIVKNVIHIFTKTNEFFNRQKAVNIAARHASKDIIALYDADVLIIPESIEKTCNLLQNKRYDIIWPYDGRFYDVPKKYHKMIDETKKLDVVDLDECTLFNSSSVGGVVFFNKSIFWQGGAANENFKGLGWEDNELYERFTKLGYIRGRMGTYLLHLNHTRKETSYNYNPYGQHNQSEYLRINAMTVNQLLVEITKWEWVK